MSDRLSRGARRSLASLRRSVRRHPVALALSGGGSQGSFQAGALLFLYDVVGIAPKVVCGSSVGAINGAKLAEGQSSAGASRSIDELAGIWLGLRTNSDLWLADPWLEKLRAHSAWASEIRGRAAEHGAAGSQARVVMRMLGEIVRNPPDTDGTLEAVRTALRARSLLRNDPIRARLEGHLRPELIATSGIALRIGMVCLETGDLRYVTESGALLSREGADLGLPPVGIVEAAFASSSIPLIFPPTRIGNEHYIDAGVREILPLKPAMSLLGSSGVVFGVVASAPGIPTISDVEDRGLLDLARRISSDISPDETLHKELERTDAWKGRVECIMPEFDVHDGLSVDPCLIAASVDYGYMRAADILLDLNNEAGELTSQITRTRMELRGFDGPVAGPFVTTEPAELSPAEADEQRVAGNTKLAELIDRRRAMGAPLRPASK